MYCGIGSLFIAKRLVHYTACTYHRWEILGHLRILVICRGAVHPTNDSKIDENECRFKIFKDCHPSNSSDGRVQESR